MPGSIRYFNKDPNGVKGRWDTFPSGVYYHRGHGWWSKFAFERDIKKLSKDWKIDVIGKLRGTTKRRTKIPQTGDGYLPR